MPSYNPVKASIQKYYFTNSYLKIYKQPFFKIFVYCEQITADNAEEKCSFEPILEFEFIDLQDVSFEQLNNNKFSLPKADCSTYFLEAHARIELKSLFFYNYQDNLIECDLIADIDFEGGLEIYSGCNSQKLEFKNLKLEILPVQIIN